MYRHPNLRRSARVQRVARGANVTDLIVLVVAANDGVMPQTIESVSHAKESGATIIVAVNKCDLPAANPMRPREQLAEHGLSAEDWGCLLYTSPSPRDRTRSRMPSSA